MSTKIITKFSETVSSIPTTGEVDKGEIDGAVEHATFVALFESTEDSPSVFSQWPQE